MNTFYHSAPAHQSALMIFVFFSLVLCLRSGFALRHGERTRLRVLNVGIGVLLFALEAVIGHAFSGMRYDEPYREILTAPMWLLWCAAAVSFLILTAEAWIVFRADKQSLNRDSVKQAMDILPEAICYFTPEGAVRLCNLQMYRLFRTLAQSDLQTLTELHTALDGCDGRSGVIRLSEALRTYLFPSGKAWRYYENRVTASDGITYTEAIFTDITELYEDNLKLGEQTKRLTQISRDLKLLSDNVLTAAREQEILSAKTALHDQMGAGVLAVRKILQSGKTAEAAYAVELFRKAVRTFRRDNELPVGRSELAEFLHDAEAIGVKVSLTGELPRSEDASHIFILAMRECLTNGVRHADADEITISTVLNASAAVLQITNNGTVPKSPVKPKGGLKNLKLIIAKQGGSMEIKSAPTFMLTVTVPLQEEGA